MIPNFENDELEGFYCWLNEEKDTNPYAKYLYDDIIDTLEENIKENMSLLDEGYLPKYYIDDLSDTLEYYLPDHDEDCINTQEHWFNHHTGLNFAKYMQFLYDLKLLDSDFSDLLIKMKKIA